MFIFWAFASGAWAQDNAGAAGQVWLQIQARPSLAETKKRLRYYAGRLADVKGFHMRGRWYAVALGPYTPERAEELRQKYLAEGLIPADSFIAAEGDFTQQIWPIGAKDLGQGSTGTAPTNGVPAVPAEPQDPQPVEAPTEAPTEAQTAPVASDDGQGTEPLASKGQQSSGLIAPAAPPPETTPAVGTQPSGPRPSDETKAEALKSEAALERAQKEELQRALLWAGVYDGAVDAAFGPGTRTAMAAWQEKNKFDPTGVLTTAQRAELVGQFMAVFQGMELTPVSDDKAGITITMPLGLVKFGKYDYPFVHYDPHGESTARVLLISQTGNANTLRALYDTMQTLSIVPKTGPRALQKNGFSLVGEGDDFISQTQVWLKDGALKGFTLIWPTGDEERRTRLWDKMQTSFEPFGEALTSADIAVDEQRADLMAGLEIRKPKHTRTGFYVDSNGAVLTVADIAQSCGRLTVNDVAAEVVTSDAGLGLALLRPAVPLAPPSVARLSAVAPRLQSEVAVAGFSYGGVLGSATVSYGKLADLRGLDGNENLARLDVVTHEGDIGGPVFDGGGQVIGVLQAVDTPGKSIPENVGFATAPRALAEFMQKAGIAPSTPATDTATDPDTDTPLAPERLTRDARKMTVLVECWE